MVVGIGWGVGYDILWDLHEKYPFVHMIVCLEKAIAAVDLGVSSFL